MKTQPLPIAATTITALALLTATPIPVLGTNDDLQRLTIGATIIIWIAYIAHATTTQIHQHLAEARADVGEIRRHTQIEHLLKAAGHSSEIEFPTPHGDIRTIPTSINGTTVLVGVDETTHLADVIDLQRAINGEDRAAQ